MVEAVGRFNTPLETTIVEPFRELVPSKARVSSESSSLP